MQRASVIGTVVCLLFLFVAGGVPAWAEEPADSDPALPVDPGLARTGTLPGGLTYWVYPHAMPKGKVMLLFHIASGSLHESEEQRGLAHYLEHMAFNGSENFPSGEVIQFFESMGMAFGQHQNAFTSFDQTTYMLSLPNVETETIDRGLLFLGDVAHRLTISEEEVEKERGVILEEERSRRGVGMRMMEQGLPLLLPGSRLARRIPIGDLEVIRKTTAAALRAYYETWYRPGRTTLLVVGDIDPAVVEPRIKAALADWKEREGAVPEVGSGVSPREGLDAAVMTDPELTDVQVQFNVLRERQPMATVSDFRRGLRERLATSILNRRLSRMVQEGEAAFVEAGLSRGQPMVDHVLLDLGIGAKTDTWREALRQVAEEAQRVRVHGVDAAELDRAREGLLSGMERAADNAESRSAEGVAMGLNADVTLGRAPMSPVQRRDLAARLLPSLTAEEVDRAFADLMDPKRTLVLVALPQAEGVTVPSRQDVLDLLRHAFTADVEERAASLDVGSVFEKDPEPGAVAKRTAQPKLGVTTLVMENGVRAHVRPIPDVQGVHLRLSLHGGVPEESAATRGLTEAAALALRPGSMAAGKLSPADISEWLSPRQVQVGGTSDDTSLSLDVSGSPESLEDGLRLAHLLLTQPRVDAVALDAWKEEVESQLRQLETAVPVQGMLALRRVTSGGDLRLTLPTLERYQAITVEDAQAWLDRMVREAPLEVAISGGIELADAERLLRTYFGSLPPREDRFKEVLDLRKVQPGTGPVREDVAVKTITPLSVVALGWRGVARDRDREQIALVHAGMMLSSRLLKVVREERGLTYSIGSGYRFTDYEGMDGLLVQFTADPAKAAAAADVAEEVVLGFAKEGPTEEEVQAIDRQMANVLGTEMQQPGFWISALARLHGNGRTLPQFEERLGWLQGVDAELTKKALADIAKDERFVRVIAAPATTKEEAEEPAPAGEGAER